MSEPRSINKIKLGRDYDHSGIVIYECRVYDAKKNLIRVIPEVRLEEYIERPLPKKLSLKFGEKE